MDIWLIYKVVVIVVYFVCCRPRNGGYRAQIGKNFMFGLSIAAKAPSTTYTSIDFAIYIDVANLQIYENGGF
jgi:hypothetical protein